MEEQLNQELQRIEKQPEQLSSLPLSKPISGLTDQENSLVALKRMATPFGKMKPEELLTMGKIVLVKISVITGWQTPEDDLQTILVDQFTKKIRESYPIVNLEEVEYAFRTYGVNVQDWGKQMNLSLIDQVMTPYMNSRKHIDQMEETDNLREADKLAPPKEDLSDQAMTLWADELRQRIKAGNYSVLFMPMQLYEHFAKKGKLNKSAKEKQEYVLKAVNFRELSLVESLEKMEDRAVRKRLNEFLAMKVEECFTGDEMDQLKSLTRKMILFDYLKNFSDAVDSGKTE